MSNRDEFISLITEFKTVSPSISEEQRKGLLRRAVQQFDIDVDEAVEILNASGLIIGESIDYFQVLGLSRSEIENLSESEISDQVIAAHKRLYSASLEAGGRPRADGRTEEQWRTLLNQARDTLIDPEKRNTTDIVVDHEEAEDAEKPPVPLHLLEVMVLIPEGEFKMGGSDDEGFRDEMPVHDVNLDAFYIDKYPVTNEEFKEFVDANPHWDKPRGFDRYFSSNYHDGYYLHHWEKNNYPRERANHPVVHVSWYAAMAYAQWKGKRLPTEAEWEKAARGGLNDQKYPWGNEIDAGRANYHKRHQQTTPVGRYPANGYGLYDMVGNVWEWCLDEWDKSYYAFSSYDNPISGGSIESIVRNYTDSKVLHVLRGGSWYNTVENIRVAKRSGAVPTYANSNIGFRCVIPVGA